MFVLDETFAGMLIQYVDKRKLHVTKSMRLTKHTLHQGHCACAISVFWRSL